MIWLISNLISLFMHISIIFMVDYMIFFARENNIYITLNLDLA